MISTLQIQEMLQFPQSNKFIFTVWRVWSINMCECLLKSQEGMEVVQIWTGINEAKHMLWSFYRSCSGNINWNKWSLGRQEVNMPRPSYQPFYGLLYHTLPYLTSLTLPYQPFYERPFFHRHLPSFLRHLPLFCPQRLKTSSQRLVDSVAGIPG